MSISPTPILDLEQLARRMDACRRELAALRKLYRMARAEQEAREARDDRAERGAPGGGPRDAE